MTEIKDAFKEFDSVARKFDDYGACDSEPQYVMRNYLRRTLKGDKPHLPKTGSDWELYTYSMKCGKAARSLTAALRKLEKTLKKFWFTEREWITAYLS